MRLRPVFWKWKQSPRVFSGWAPPSSGDELGELWAPPHAVFDACAVVRHDFDLVTRVIAAAAVPRLDTTIEGEPVDVRRMPADLPIERALRLGDRVCFEHDVAIIPYTVIAAGERGVIREVASRSGMVDIRMELLHIGLGEFENCAWLIPHQTDEWLSAIEECE